MAAIGVLLAGIIWGTSTTSTLTFKPPAGVSLFALFFVVSQSIERLTEFASYFPVFGARVKIPHLETLGAIRNLPKIRTLDGTRAVSKATAIANRNSALANAINLRDAGRDGAQAEVIKAAQCQQDIENIRRNRKVFFFGWNTAIAAIAAGHFNMLLLTTIGVDKPERWLDIAVTAIAVGAGTQPLHELTQNLMKGKESNEDGAKTA